jgi:hypothetical protein
MDRLTTRDTYRKYELFYFIVTENITIFIRVKAEQNDRREEVVLPKETR